MVKTNSGVEEIGTEGEQIVQQIYIYKLLLLGGFLGRLGD